MIEISKIFVSLIKQIIVEFTKNIGECLKT